MPEKSSINNENEENDIKNIKKVCKQNISDEERKRRSERMKQLRAKLDNIAEKPSYEKAVKERNFVADVKKKIEEKRLKKQNEEKKNDEKQNEDYRDDKDENIDDIDEQEEENDDDDSDEEYEKPIKKPIKKMNKPILKNKTIPKIKSMPRKVLKIKYYEEPSQAEMMQDRLFLENQHKYDNEAKYLKNSKPKNDLNDISNKLFNY